MNKSKKAVVLSLAAIIALSPMAVKAGAEIIDAIPISEPVELAPELISAPVDEAKVNEFIKFKGKIERINNEDGRLSIEVRNDNKEGLDAIIAYINEDVVLLNKEKMDFAHGKDLEVGMEVSIFYHKDTIMAMSYPPLLGPDVVVIDSKEDNMSVMVSKFNKDLLNAEEDMYIRIYDETILLDKDGNKVEREDLIDNNLIVFYDIVLESYPAQTSPKKVIVLPKKDNVIIEVTKEIYLKDELVKNEEGITMIPLRVVAETLGYEVSWNQETKTAELVKGPQWTAVTIGEDKYNFARMYVELGTAPVLVHSKTYVPISFAEEILKANVELLEDGGVKVFQ